MCPVIASTSNGAAAPATAGAGSFSPLVSPYSMAGNTCAPHHSVRQFQVKIGGVQHFKSPVDYNFDMFMNEISKSNSVQGGLESGLASSLISYSNFQTNSGFIFVDLSRKQSEADDVINKSVEVTFVNNSLARIDYYCFIGLAESKTVNVETGKIVL